MSLNKDLLTRKVLLDTRLTPVDKVIYLSIMEEFKDGIIEDLRDLKKYLTLQEGRVVKELNNERLERSFALLTEIGYIGPEGSLVNVQENPIEEQVELLMDYISESRIVRGYSKRKLFAEVYKSTIRGRLRDGHSLEECKAVINYRFESDWHKQNHKFLVPDVIFDKSKFSNALNNIKDVKEWAYLEVTKYGVREVTEEEVIGEM